MNSIHMIAPYRLNGVWVFDDAATGLNREPFVGNANTVIDKLVADISGADKGFALLFSPTPFPGHAMHAHKVAGDEFGTTYRELKSGIEFWLCPALFKYITPAPEEIYACAQEAA